MLANVNPNKVAVVGGIAVCATAALYLYSKRRSTKNRRKPSPNVFNSKAKKSSPKSNSIKRRESTSNDSLSCDSCSESETEIPVQITKKNSDEKLASKSKNSSNSLSHDKNRENSSNLLADNNKVGSSPASVKNGVQQFMSGNGPVVPKENGVGNNCQRIESWYEEVERSRQSGFEESKLNVPNDYGSSDLNGVRTTRCDGEVTKVLMRKHLTSPTPKTNCADSPSLASDGRSEESQDSGKGTSMCLTSSMSPVEELIEVPPMYEFEVPQDIVGLIIGRKGTTIKWFTQESGAHIVIRHHYYSDRHKICTIEGTREQINKCLRLIRHKFPPSRFPELKLTPLLPPPIASPHSPMFDSIIHLSLPDGVKCEVVLSSLVDAGHFFVQQPTHPTFPSLSRLDQYMLAVYNQPAGVPGLPRPIDIGVICASPVLGGWYRAQTIAFYEETDEVLVKFVDYGGYSKIPAMDLRQIRSDFMTLPFQATECCLARIKPVDEFEGWSSRATAFIEDCTRSKVVEALVVDHLQETATVELYCTAEDGISVTVNRLLVDSGFAQWVDDEDSN